MFGARYEVEEQTTTEFYYIKLDQALTNYSSILCNASEEKTVRSYMSFCSLIVSMNFVESRLRQT